MWQNHHALFRLVQHIDRKTVFWNLLLLAATVLIPFATTTLGSYPTMPASTFLYGAVLTTCATFYNLLLRHLVRTNSFAPEVPHEAIASTVHGYRMGWLLYAGATLLALVLRAAPIRITRSVRDAGNARPSYRSRNSKTVPAPFAPPCDVVP